MAREITLHPYQERAIFSEKRIIAMIAGLQSGKTTSGSIWTRMRISQFNDPSDCFIVAFPTYKIYNSSTLPAFMKLHSDLGTLNKSDYEFRMHHGPKVYFRSLDNPWSAEGITNCRGIWLDEGGLIATQGFINLMGRAAPKQAPIFISTTPYYLNNFLFRDLYEPWRAGKRPDVDIIQFRSIDNPHFPKAEYARQKQLLDPRMFAMRFEGKFERMAGLVYQDFDFANYHDAFIIDKSKFHILGGIDWGYTDPFAITVRAISRNGKFDFQTAEYKKSGHTPDEQISITKQYQKVYGIDMFYADSAEPGLIALFQKAGIPITAVSDKNIEYGISVHQAIIRSKVHQVFRGKCPETEAEYEAYQYKDFDIDSDKTAKPLDINNHLMDANRYVSVMTINIRDRANVPFVPDKTHLQRLLAGEFAQHSPNDDEWS